MIVIMIMNLNLYSAKTIEEYSKALYIKLKNIRTIPTAFLKSNVLRWLETVFSTFTLMGRYSYSLSLDAMIMVSKNCPTIGEHVVIIFVT